MLSGSWYIVVSAEDWLIEEMGKRSVRIFMTKKNMEKKSNCLADILIAYNILYAKSNVYV